MSTILVALALSADNDPGRDFAISLADALKGRVTGRAYALEPEMSVAPFDGIAASLLQEHRAAAGKKAKAALEKFDEAASHANVQSSHKMAHATPRAAAAEFARQARVCDFSVATRSAEGIDHVGDLFVEAALFYSGRPIVIVPKKKDVRFSTDRVLIAWDGGVHATRAVALSIPILALAKKIEILVVGNKEELRKSDANDLCRNLENHGLQAEVVLRDDGRDTSDAIALEAKIWSASLLVMGGYGHSRLQEWIFGGVTRSMLTSSALPVLMAH
jgi:nucleotide-binding universal stress UspA family protein